MIELSHVYKTYVGGIHALQNVNLTIEKGEFAFITGPSGAGKTTLFRMISAFDKPTSGNLHVAGYDLTQITSQQIPYFRRNIGVVFQDFRLLKDRTLYENIILPLIIQKQPFSYIDKRSKEVLDQVGLLFKKDQYPDQVSGGEQQRTAIARALIHKPQILIADEPTGNLDPDLSEEIMDLFAKVNAQGTTVFIATHDHSMVKRRGYRRIQIVGGNIEKESTC